VRGLLAGRNGVMPFGGGLLGGADAEGVAPPQLGLTTRRSAGAGAGGWDWGGGGGRGWAY
jgi:hypothetical protein